MRIADRIPRLFQHIYSLLMVMLSWGLFYYEDMGAMGKFYSSLFGNTTATADIAEQTGLSTATISRVSKCLEYGNGGYRAAIRRLREEETDI